MHSIHKVETDGAKNKPSEIFNLLTQKKTSAQSAQAGDTTMTEPWYHLDWWVISLDKMQAVYCSVRIRLMYQNPMQMKHVYLLFSQLYKANKFMQRVTESGHLTLCSYRDTTVI